jgi:predicted amidophosphoribosyltransferase
VLDVLFPLLCAGCGRRPAGGLPLCADCTTRLPRAPLVAPPVGIDAWAAPFAYEGAARELVARIKYRNVRAVVPWLARRMAEAAASAGIDAVVVTWAPTSPAHRRARGFDPAELLARAVARSLQRPTRSMLVRAPGPPQTGLPAAARRVGPRFAPRRVAPASVLLIDDVATTGATLAAAAATMRAAGAGRVVALTAARTPWPGDI